MHSIEIPDRRIKIQFASCIEEMDPRDFIYMMELLIRHQNSDISMEEFRDMLCLRLLKVKKSFRYHMMNEEQREQVHESFLRISELLDSFFTTLTDDGKEVPALNLNFIRNMIPRIGKYYGPDDALTNCTFFEYKQAVIAFNHYNEHKDEESLNQMIAVLYRPSIRLLALRKLLPGHNGQARVAFTSSTNPGYLEKRTRIIAKLPVPIKMGIYLWFNSCVKYLREGRPEIDGIEIDLSILYEGSTEGGIAGIGLQGIIFSLSESQVFGTIEKTADSNLYDVYARLYQLTADYKNQLEKSKKK